MARSLRVGVDTEIESMQKSKHERVQMNREAAQDGDDKKMMDSMLEWVDKESRSEEVLKESAESDIKWCKDMMTRFKGTSWGDQAAFQLVMALFFKYDLPEHQQSLGYDSDTSRQSFVWSNPKPARLDMLICSAMPVAKVTLGKCSDEGCRVLDHLTYEEAMEELRRWLCVADQA